MALSAGVSGTVLLRAFRSHGLATGFRHQSTSTLLVVEHDTMRVAGPTLSAATAAQQLGGSITALVAGHGVGSVAEQAASIPGVSKVLVADHNSLSHQLPEPLSELLKAVQSKRNFSHILASSSTTGKNALPRAAALLGVQPVSDIIKILGTDTYVRPIYAGNALATVKFTPSSVQVLTVRPTSFAAAAAASSTPCPIEAVAHDELSALQSYEFKSKWVAEDVRKSERPELGAARVVVCGGRALKSAENFQILERLADLMGGAVGASRAAVDAGYAANDLQVGQTGKVVAPDLYIGIGISGAIQHLAGMKDSKTIVAINNDPDAPIFEVADYGLVQDLFVALPEFEEELKKLKAAA